MGFVRRLVLIFLISLSACATTVKAYEREKLAHRGMRPEMRPEETRAMLHMMGAREGAVGAAGEAGGGCGCN